MVSRTVKRAVTAYWYPENNFGDQLTPELLRSYGLLPLFTPTFENCEIASVGSILEVVPGDFNGAILGSGFLLPTTQKEFPRAKILSVRGKLTAQKLSLPDTVRLGDPGILVDRIYKKSIAETQKKYTLGFVPHYKDKNFAALNELAIRFPKDICIIDVCRSPVDVVADIASCRNIMSSSLHGLVVADSLGIPSCPVHLSERLRGGIFKFRDYYSVYELEPVFHRINGNESVNELCDLIVPMNSEKVTDVKKEVHLAFCKFGELRK